MLKADLHTAGLDAVRLKALHLFWNGEETQIVQALQKFGGFVHKSVTVKVCFPEILPQRLRNILHGLDHLQRTIQFSNEEIIGLCNAVVQDGKGPQFVVDASPGIHGCRVMDRSVKEFLLLDIDGGVWKVDELGIVLKTAVLTDIQIFLHEIGGSLILHGYAYSLCF